MGKSIRAKGKRRIRLLKRDIASKVHFPRNEQAIQAALAAAVAAPPAEIPRLRDPNAATGAAEERRGREGAPTPMTIEGSTPPSIGTSTTAATTDVAAEGSGQTLKKRKKKGSSNRKGKKQNKKHRKWIRTFGK